MIPVLISYVFSRFYVVQFCPHDLFTNTKADLGPCNKIHDDDLKRKFQDEKESYKKSQYLDEFLRFCQRMLTELQTRIKKAKERLYLTQNDDAFPTSSTGQNKEAEEKIQLISQRITSLVEEAETAGCEGNVEQAQGLMKLSDQLREERDQLRRSIMPFLKEEYAAQQKAMEVCDTCGAFLIVGDAPQRIDDHLMGKQHIGYARLRAAVDKINEERRKWREERDKEMEERRKKRDEEEDRRRRRDREKDKEKSRDRDRDRNRERRRSRSRDRRRRSRSRSRDRRRRQSRSRDRDDRRRRSRERHSASASKRRSRSRDRDRDRGRRTTSKDRDRTENGAD